MESLTDASLTALSLLVSGDAEIWSIISISFGVSLQAILYTAPVALLTAYTLAHFEFPGRRTLISLFHTLLAVPAVAIGLTLYLILSRSGPFGDLNLLFTQTAMVLGQMALSFPILVAMGHSALQSADPRAWETARTLGATPIRAMLTVMHEVRYGLFVAVIAAFGRIIAEVGCSMVVGGNFLHHTRNVTSAIALETSRGQFSQGIALGIVLLVLAFILNSSLSTLRHRLGMRA